jgi:hypothetical protein
MNPRRLADPSVLIFSDVVIALAVWGKAILVRASWHTSTIVGVIPTSTLAGVIPSRCGWSYVLPWGSTLGMASTRLDELRCQSYATLGALEIGTAFLGLHQGQDVPAPCSSVGFWRY